MPKFDLCRYVEVRYARQIEAPDADAAELIAEETTDEEWGEAEAVTADHVIIFTEAGDEGGKIRGG